MLRIIGVCLLVMAFAVAIAWLLVDPPRVTVVKEQVVAAGAGWQASETEVQLAWNWRFVLPVALCLSSGLICVVVSFVRGRAA